MSKNSIPISPKHGLNPTIPICFFCGQEKNEIALMGKLKGDVEAPRAICLDYEPCDHCKELFAQGILCIGVTDCPLPDGRPPISGSLYPTGAYMVVTEDFIQRLIVDEEVRKNVLDKRTMLLDHQILTQLQEDAAKS